MASLTRTPCVLVRRTLVLIRSPETNKKKPRQAGLFTGWGHLAIHGLKILTLLRCLAILKQSYFLCLLFCFHYTSWKHYYEQI